MSLTQKSGKRGRFAKVSLCAISLASSGQGQRKERHMASKGKEVRLAQRTHWENKLNQRLSVLADKGLEPQRIAKDAAVRSIRGKIRKTEARLAIRSAS